MNVLNFPPQREPETHLFHEIGVMAFNEDGPSHLEVGCSYTTAGRTAGQWLVDVEIFPRADLVDRFDPNQFDAQNGQIIPESSWAISPQQAFKLAAMLTRAAEEATLRADATAGD
jgi:hypothetical protein